MTAIGLFAVLLILIVVVGDWIHFVRLSADSVRYGCRIGSSQERLLVSESEFIKKFDSNGVLPLTNGVARLFHQDRYMLLRPHYRLGAFRFPTAWPLKASVQVESQGEATQLTFTKRMPWSSAILTLAWFVLVGGGTLVFLVMYFLEGGMASLSGMLMGFGITAIGLFVFVFGLIMVSLAYRLEHDRILKTYQDFERTMCPLPLDNPSSY